MTRRSSGNRIYLRHEDDVDAQPLVGTEGATGPFFSPDGQWIGFAAGGALKRVSISGGAPQTISATVETFLGANWSDGGSIVFHEWGSGLFRVPADGGTPQVLTTVDSQGDERMHVAPHVLPGGRAALFAVVRAGRPASVEVVEFSTLERKPLTDGTDPHYLSSGHVVLTRDGRLYTARFDPTSLVLTGPLVPVVEDIQVQVEQDRGALAMARNGTLAYLPAATNTSRLVAVSASGDVRTLSADRRRFTHPRLAPDGSRLVVNLVTEAGGEIWVYSLGRTTGVRASVTNASRPIWSHDGKHITFQKDGSLYSIPADDSMPPELVLARGEDASALFPLAWSRDGATLVYSRPATGTYRDVFTLPLGGKPRPFVATTRDERSAMLSPDGRWMVYAALETGREEEIYVEPYPGPGERQTVSDGGGREPVWSPRGDAIFYRSADGQRMMVAKLRTAPTLAFERPRPLFEGSFRTAPFWSNYDIHPRTGEFLMLAADEPAQPPLTIGINLLRAGGAGPEQTGGSR